MGLASHAVMAHPAPSAPIDPLVMSPFRWWQVSDSASVTLSTTKIAQVNDKSGNGGHLVQATDASRPTLNAGGVNGKDYAQFTGSQLMANAVASLAQPFTVFGVVRCSTNPSSGQNEAFMGAAGNGALIYMFNSGSNTNFSTYSGSGSGLVGPVNDLGWHVVTALFNGASSTLRVDGAQVAAGTLGTTGITSALTVGQFSGGGSGLIGGMVEWLIAASPSDANRNAYEAQLKSLYGTP